MRVMSIDISMYDHLQMTRVLAWLSAYRFKSVFAFRS